MSGIAAIQSGAALSCGSPAMNVAGSAAAAPPATQAAGAAFQASAAAGLMSSSAAQLCSTSLQGLSRTDLMQAFLVALLLKGTEDDRQKGSSTGDLLLGMALMGAMGGAQGCCNFSMDAGSVAAAYSTPAAAATMSAQA
jgi:hypothetical protein